MVLPSFITFKVDDIFVCSTREPHYIFRVKYTKTEYWVVGYRIFLEFAGTLGGNRLMLGDDIHGLTMEALQWYAERVNSEPERFKKYKL